MKICTGCKLEKPFQEFSWKNKAKGKYASQCKDCMRVQIKKHYVANRPKYVRKARESEARNRKLLREYIGGHLQQNPCVDCGESDPVVLQFDHVRGVKVKNISAFVREMCSLSSLIAEIAKCDVRCGNCHLRRTAKQFNWWTLTL